MDEQTHACPMQISEEKCMQQSPSRSSGIALPSRIGRPCLLHTDRKPSLPSLELKHHGAILTSDTDSFIIGQRVWVGGIKPGQIVYIGETHFAPGEWAGIVLDEPNGKNDGCVAGKRYFQCEPKRGIFSRLTRLTQQPLSEMTSPKQMSPESIARYGFSPERSKTVSPTSSIRSHSNKNVGKFGITVGDRVIVSSGFGSRPGILKYIGETKFAEGNWCGVQLDDPTGKNDGSVDDTRYFECPPKHGIFVPIAKVSLSPTVKKSRFSKTGSRESLTSVGTLNSVATTNTSRLRMSIQKLPTPSSKTVSSQRSNYSLQDLIREKQNHIEQLMIERELDREDAQNQAHTFQKTISELQNRINELECQLKDEKKRTDDLQYSVDEATFCGDELNAQTQVYKERIAELENELDGLKLNIRPRNASEELGVTIIQKNEENTKGSLNSEEHLKDEIKTLLKRIQELEEKLILNDEMKEKFCLNIKELEIENSTLCKKLVLEASSSNVDDTDIKNQITKHENEIFQLQKTLHIIQSKNSLSQRNFENLEKEYSEFKSEKEFEINEAVLKINAMETALVEEKERYIRNKVHQEAIIKELQSKYDKALKALDEQNSKVENCEANKLQLIESYIQIEQLEKTLKNKEAEFDSIVENLKNQIDLLQAEINNTKRESLESLKKKESEIQLAYEKQQHWELEALAQKTENAKLSEYYKNEVMVAKNQVESLQKLEDEKIQYINELETLRQKVKSSSEIARELESKLSIQEQTFDKNSKLYEIQIKSLLEEIEMFKAKAGELKSLEENIPLLEFTKEQNEKLMNKLENLSKEYQTTKELCSAREEHICQINIEMNKLSKQLEALNQICNEHKNRNDSLLQELNNLKHTSTDSNAELIRVTQELIHKETAYIQLMENTNTKISILETELDTTKHSLDGSVKTIEKLQIELTAETSAKADFENKWKKLEDTIKTLEACVKEKESVIQQFENNSIDIENKHTLLDILVANLKSEIQQKNEDTENLIKKIATLEETNKVFAENLKKSEEDLKLLSARYDDIETFLNIEKEKVETYREEIKIKEEEQVDLVVKVQDLEEQITLSESEKVEISEKYDVLMKSLPNVKEIRNKYDDIYEENGKLKKQLTVEQEQRKGLEIDLQNVKQKIQESIHVKNEHENKINNLEIMLKEQQYVHQEKCGQLKKSLNDYENALAQMKKTNYDMKNSLMQLENNKPNLEVHDKCELIILKLEKEIKHLKDKMQQNESQTSPDVSMDIEGSNAMAQINFLNSIIGDMQKKNDTLKAKIDSLESFSNDFAQSVLHIGAKRKPATRAFCDICDVFDAHETEDCPLQDSDSPPPNSTEGDRTVPPPRKYCETCEVFGHDPSECADDITF